MEEVRKGCCLRRGHEYVHELRGRILGEHVISEMRGEDILHEHFLTEGGATWHQGHNWKDCSLFPLKCKVIGKT